MRLKTIKNIFVLFLGTCSATAYAEIALIVNPDNTMAFNEQDIKHIFLGKLKTFPDGTMIRPLNFEDASSVRQEFDRKVLKKSQPQVKAYWSKLVFTGKGIPPDKVNDNAAMLKAVAGDINAIGYIDASLVNDSVKVLKLF